MFYFCDTANISNLLSLFLGARFDLEIKEEDRTSFGFNGKGYFKSHNQLRRPKPFYSVVLSFKSLDEDALLFLSVNEAKVSPHFEKHNIGAHPPVFI